MKRITPKVIAISLGHHVDTLKRCLANTSLRKTWSDAVVMKSVTDRHLRNSMRELFKKPSLTSRTIFEQANLSEVSKSTRCRLLRKNIMPAKRTPLALRHKVLRLEWTENIKTDMELIIFIDETRATLDGPDGGEKGKTPSAGGGKLRTAGEDVSNSQS